MLRLALLIVLALAAPTAAAEPLATVAVGPDGPAQPGAPYYVALDAGAPERPHAASPADDCAAKPAGGTPRAMPSALPGSFAPYAPGCASAHTVVCAAPAGCLPVDASYNVTSGRYYVALPVTPGSAASTAITGTTGVGARFDCEGCPPPFVLA